MLSQLTIQNFGLIDKVVIEFSPRLNILTGSTGAGKSIIIEGLRFALGERFKTSQIRGNLKPCVIEAVFELGQSPLLNDEDIRDFITDDDPRLIINRQVLADGRAKIKINGFSVTVSQLKSLGDRLIDFHGANDHQMLLTESSHLGLLDRLAEFGDSKNNYLRQYDEYTRIKSKLRDIQDMSNSKERDLDMLDHQLKELSQFPITEDAYRDTADAQTKIDNAEKLHELGSALLQLFEDPDNGITDTVQKSFRLMHSLNNVDEKTASFSDCLVNIQENCSDIVLKLKDYLDSLSFNPDQAREITKQFDFYEDIKRKYGPAINDVCEFHTKAKEKYNMLTDIEHNDAGLRAKIVLSEKELKNLASKITQARKACAQNLKKTIEKELKDLDIEHVTFEARISNTDFNTQGRDKVTFFISPNAGEELKPLSDIVSSGEAARVMLALKKALSNVDPVPVLIFDEIDAQIGGRLGTVIGTKLKELSKNRQVLLITHLPQIASFADAHFKVIKEVSKGRTLTKVELLSPRERIQELSEMMSGKKKSDVSLTHAQDMLAQAAKIGTD